MKLSLASAGPFLLPAVLAHVVINWLNLRRLASMAESPATPRALINIIRSQVWPHDS